MPQTEREAALVALLDDITPVVSAADELEPAARAAVAAVCELTGWPLGHLCVPDGSGGGFVSSGVWVGAEEEFPVLREVTSRARFRPGVGIVGRVAVTGEPVWSLDVTRDPLFVRAQEGFDLGVGAAFAFPVMVAGKVAAVLEFFSHEVTPPDAPLMRVMANLGHQLGRVVERQQAQRAMEAGRRRLEQMIETSVEAFVAMDASGRIAGWNAAAERMFRLSREQALGRPLADTIVPPRHRAAHRQGLDRFLATGRPKLLNQRFEITAWRSDNSEEFPVELVIWAVRDRGEWVFNAFLHDITDRRNAEEALRVAYEREQATVARLQELDQAKNDFIDTVSHELRTPLTTIIGYLEMLADEGPVPGHYERMLHAMENNAMRLQHLVDDLLTVNTVNTGELAVDPVPVPVRELVEQAVGAVAEEAREHGSVVEVRVGPDGRRVDADRDHLVRALSALISNAIKFSPPGAPVTVRASAVGETVSIEVTDTGPGIPAAELPRIFEHFYRTRSATDQAVQGAGLGLTIARSIVEAHGGTLTAASAPGSGSTFTITLPVPAQGGPGREGS
ncbi:PAS domain S-box protein [Planomonospora sp. ID67723]|uniref:ATP-binding protein n=1 Tax=Planomonospora sp. ID67723 TaxID=2738134 RepID=UPI0018C44CE2|nr:ATP-binding protein [Planomonospora sp. ID67723]MBG0827876.1 PAS domain S-box protein [Planomonospora sp. ID67723]